MDATLLLCKRLIPKLNTDFCVPLLKESVTLILSAISQVVTHCPKEGVPAIDKTFAEVSNELQAWIANDRVIGGSVFGRCVPTASQSSKAKEEIEVCILRC